VQIEAHGHGVVGVDGAVAGFDGADDAVFVDDDVGAQGPLKSVAVDVIGLEDAVGSEHLMVHVAKQGKLDVDLLGEGGVGRGTVHADAENCCIVRINFAAIDSRLDRLELLGSTTGEGEDVDGEENIFLAVEIAELDGFPLIAEESEIRGGIADLEGELGDFILVLGPRGDRGDCGQQREDKGRG